MIPKFYRGFKHLKQVKKDISQNGEKIKSIIENYDRDKRLTLKLIASLFKEKFFRDISIMPISSILRSELDLHYRKTILKSPKLLDNNYKLMTYFYIKGISRCIKLGLNLIFIDETGFSLNNNN